MRKNDFIFVKAAWILIFFFSVSTAIFLDNKIYLLPPSYEIGGISNWSSKVNNLALRYDLPDSRGAQAFVVQMDINNDFKPIDEVPFLSIGSELQKIEVNLVSISNIQYLIFERVFNESIKANCPDCLDFKSQLIELRPNVSSNTSRVSLEIIDQPSKTVLLVDDSSYDFSQSSPASNLKYLDLVVSYGYESSTASKQSDLNLNNFQAGVAKNLQEFNGLNLRILLISIALFSGLQILKKGNR